MKPTVGQQMIPAALITYTPNATVGCINCHSQIRSNAQQRLGTSRFFVQVDDSCHLDDFYPDRTRLHAISRCLALLTFTPHHLRVRSDCLFPLIENNPFPKKSIRSSPVRDSLSNPISSLRGEHHEAKKGMHYTLGALRQEAR